MDSLFTACIFLTLGPEERGDVEKIILTGIAIRYTIDRENLSSV